MSAIQVMVVGDAATPAQARGVEAAVTAALARLPGPPGAAVTIVLTDDAALQALNRDFRGQDRPTDVLSFPVDPADHAPGEAPYLGDVVIAVGQATLSARAAGHDVEDELALLAVHGLLHLTGHEDDTDSGAAAMVRLEIALGVRRPDDLPDGLPL
jgi:probable rRNA maturation factor